MASDHPDLNQPYRDDLPTSAGGHPSGVERPAEYPAGGAGPAPARGRMMPNDYPPGYPPYAPYPPAQAVRTPTPAWVKALGGCLIAGVLATVVLACALAIAASTFFPSSPASASTAQTFAVTGVPTVRIHSTAGNIRLVPGDVGSVVVQATKYVRAFSASTAQDQLRQIAVAVTQTGDTLDVQVTGLDEDGGIHLWWSDRHVDLTVTVPARANIAATLDAGNVDVASIAGTIGIQDNAGNLTLDDVALAGSSFATDNAGNIDVSGALQPGASFAARTNAGNVTATLPRATSAHLTASTNAGNVTVDPAWPVSVLRHVASGSASGDLVPDPTGTLILETNAGNVTLNAL